jgi:hypothetical protein
VTRTTELQEPAAQAVLEERRATVARWENGAQAKRDQLAELEGRVGAEVLADEGAAERLAGEMATLRAGIDVAERAAAAAELLVPDAERAVWRAQAADKRDEAAALRREASERQKTTDRLIKQLQNHEACEYKPTVSLDDEPIDILTPMGYAIVSDRAMNPRTPRSPHRTGRLLERAEWLDRDAADLEARAQVPVARPDVHLMVSAASTPRFTEDEATVTAVLHVTPGECEPMLFELVVDGRVMQSIELPDADGRRGRQVAQHLQGRPLPSQVEVRCNGELIATHDIALPVTAA